MNRILLITDRRPIPGHGGGERTLSIYNALRRIAEVDVLLLLPPGVAGEAGPGEYVIRLGKEADAANPWYWRRRTYLLQDLRPDRRVRQEFEALVRARRYDAFFGRYHLPFLTGCTDFGPSFVDVDDLITDTWSSPVPLFDRLRRHVYHRALSHYRTVFVTKQADARKLRHPDLRLLPCISTQPERTGPISYGGVPGRMLFVGWMNWPPNRDAVNWFIQNCLTPIRERFPDAVLRVVGRHGSSIAGPEGVSAADFVPELEEEYRQASIVVCPTLSGTGSVVKLAEAVAYGLPVVATAHAARGYEGLLEPGRDFAVASSAEEFISACIQLLSDDRRRNAMAASARQTSVGRLDQLAIDNCIRDAVTPWLRTAG